MGEFSYLLLFFELSLLVLRQFCHSNQTKRLPLLIPKTSQLLGYTPKHGQLCIHYELTITCQLLTQSADRLTKWQISISSSTHIGWCHFISIIKYIKQTSNVLVCAHLYNMFNTSSCTRERRCVRVWNTNILRNNDRGNWQLHFVIFRAPSALPFPFDRWGA